MGNKIRFPERSHCGTGTFIQLSKCVIFGDRGLTRCLIICQHTVNSEYTWVVEFTALFIIHDLVHRESVNSNFPDRSKILARKLKSPRRNCTRPPGSSRRVSGLVGQPLCKTMQLSTKQQIGIFRNNISTLTGG